MAASWRPWQRLPYGQLPPLGLPAATRCAVRAGTASEEVASSPWASRHAAAKEPTMTDAALYLLTETTELDWLLALHL